MFDVSSGEVTLNISLYDYRYTRSAVGSAERPITCRTLSHAGTAGVQQKMWYSEGAHHIYCYNPQDQKSSALTILIFVVVTFYQK
jgi:hypothetical protein